MNNSVRKITDGAMMVAIVGMFVLLDRQLANLLMVYAIWLVPLPMVMYSVKYGWKSAMIPFVSLVFLSLIIGGPQTLFYILSSSVCGIVYGQGVRSGWNNLRLLITTMMFTIFSNLITTVLFASFFGYDIAMEISELGKTMTQMTGPGSALQLNLPQELDLNSLLKTVLVLGCILTGVMEGLIVHLLSNFLLKRMKIKVAPPKPLSQLMMPKWCGYVCFLLFIGCNFTNFLNRLPASGQELMLIGGMIGAIILVVFGYLCCLVYGAVHYHKNISFILVLVTILLFPIMLPLLATLGFLYVTTDMREKMLRR